MFAMLSTLCVLSGTLQVDHQPVANQTILVIDSKGDSILQSSITDSTGSFSVQFPDTIIGSTIQILVKVRNSNIVSTEYRELVLASKSVLNINISPSELQNLQVEVKKEAGLPESYDFMIHPVSVEGVPDSLCKFLDYEGPRILGFYYAHRYTDGMINLKIKRGVYRMNANHFIINRSAYAELPPDNFHTFKSTSDGAILTGDDKSGFEINVNSSTNATLFMVRSKD